MKIAIFTVTDSGEDGRAKATILFASKDENERDEWLSDHINKAYFAKGESVQDLEQVAIAAKNQLNGLQLLALGMEQDKTRKIKAPPLRRS